MPKYQFFSKPESHRNKFTYLNMGSGDFLDQKNQLLALNFEVDGDVIFANSAEDAVEKFKSNFCAPAEDYANSDEGGGLATLVFESFKSLRNKIS